MKRYLIYTALLLLAFAGAAVALTCPYNEGHATLLTTKCEVQKPVDAMTGEEIAIVCIKSVKENNVWVQYPMKGLHLAIFGYNAEGTLLQNMSRSLNSKGVTVFTPQVAGEYVIETLIPQQESNSAQAMNVPWVATFSVGENPVKSRGVVTSTPTGGAIAEEPSAEPDTGEAAAEPDTEAPFAEPAGAAECQEARGLFDFVLNGTRDAQDKADASNFVLMVVGFLIS
jgi:hypothetical protein